MNRIDPEDKILILVSDEALRSKLIQKGYVRQNVGVVVVKPALNRKSCTTHQQLAISQPFMMMLSFGTSMVQAKQIRKISLGRQ